MKIKDIIDQFIAGDWGEETCSNDTPCAVTCVRGADIIPISEYNFSTIPIRYISQQSYSKKCLQVGDIIIEKSGGSPTQSTGRVSFVSQELLDSVGPVVCSNFCTAFRVKKGWNPLYVYYYFQFIYNLGLFFNFEGKTSGLKNLQLDAAFAAIPIKDVSESAQNKIVAILQGLEKKITINRRINQNLEAMAKQLYDYWFVQFDFPNEEGKPYKSSGGVMVWNEKLKREIPKQWENCTLSYYVGRITNGLNPRKNFVLGDGDNYYVTIRSLLGTDIDWNNCDRCNDEALAKINARSQLQIGDVIFSAIGTIGRTYYIQENPVNWNISETSFTLRANPNIPSELFYSILRSDEVQLQADKKAMGSTLRCLVMDSFLNIPLVKIPTIIGCLFTESIKPIIKQQYLINKENRSLIKQRDELLPLLMNGQASVNSDL